MKTVVVKGKCFVFDDDFVEPSGSRRLDKGGYLIYYKYLGMKNGKRKRAYIYAHRHVMSAVKGQIVDHIDGDIANNQKKNLRFVTAAESSWNRRIVGATLLKKTGKWQASIQRGGKTQYLGLFSSKSDAMAAYREACALTRSIQPREKADTGVKSPRMKP